MLFPTTFLSQRARFGCALRSGLVLTASLTLAEDDPVVTAVPGTALLPPLALKSMSVQDLLAQQRVPDSRGVCGRHGCGYAAGARGSIRSDGVSPSSAKFRAGAKRNLAFIFR